jgi:hypothetical protein
MNKMFVSALSLSLFASCIAITQQEETQNQAEIKENVKALEKRRETLVSGIAQIFVGSLCLAASGITGQIAYTGYKEVNDLTETTGESGLRNNIIMTFGTRAERSAHDSKIREAHGTVFLYTSLTAGLGSLGLALLIKGIRNIYECP